MTETIIAYSNEPNSRAAGAALGQQISDKLKGESPHAVIVFASSQFSYTQLLEGLRAKCRPQILVGCSSAGEFVSGWQGESSASALAIRSDEMRFTSSVASGHGGKSNVKSTSEHGTTFSISLPKGLKTAI